MNGRRDRRANVGTRRRSRVAGLAVTVLAGTTACSPGHVVTTDEAPAVAQTSAAAPTSTNRPTNEHLANAFDYFAEPEGRAGYYFTSPSSRWVCAIFPREKAGCQAATGAAIPIEGAPDTVPDADGDDTAPNALALPRTGDPQFAAVEPPGYALEPGPAVVLPFNKVLIVADFQCNVQEASGISCQSLLSDKGFTFSTDGFTPQYTDLPV